MRPSVPKPGSRPQPQSAPAPRDREAKNPAAPARPERRDSRPPHVTPALVSGGIPHGATEIGWLPDCVLVGDSFEVGLAFMADAQGRITRFSRDPADLAKAHRLAGQAILPGLINAHSHAMARVLRGRGHKPSVTSDTMLGERAAKFKEEDIFDIARAAFVEMLLSGITCVGEFQSFGARPGPAGWPSPSFPSLEIVRAAHDVGIRIALLAGASLRAGPRDVVPSTAVDAWMRETESVRTAIEQAYPADEAWTGAAPASVAQVSLDAFKAIAGYARTQRFRLHTHLGSAADAAACLEEYGRRPVSLLADAGAIDKRFTAVGAGELSEDDVRVLGTSRSHVCLCGDERPGNAEKLQPAGVTLATGTDSHQRIDLLAIPRAGDPLLAATVGGARSLGATGGALEVGRPADFFTINLLDPRFAGADPASLRAHVLAGLDRSAIREVWIGARQRVVNGRHPAQGAIMSRFADVQKRLWA